MANKMAETDMYQPVKDFLTGLGYSVDGEVKGCDIAAMKGDELLIVEMKLHFNMTLLFQALERQKITGQVYVAIPRPRKSISRNMSQIKGILRRLELGLMTVAMDSPTRVVDVLLSPGYGGKKDERLKAAVKKELAGRSMAANTGGSRGGVKLNTAFRERCIRVACVLEKHGPITAAQLVRDFACEKDAHAILYRNHYGWFEKLGKGLYGLSKLGRLDLEDEHNAKLVQYYRQLVPIPE